MNRIDEIVRLMVEEASEKSGNPDFVSRLYAVEMKVGSRIMKIMEALREEERDGPITSA